jgi:hypothetical protein
MFERNHAMPTLTQRAALGAIAALGLACATPAFAVDIDSAYTDLDIDQCTTMEADDFGVTWACPGYKGIPVMVSESDLRNTISFGFDPESEPAAHQTMPPFNSLGGQIEWRISNKEGQWKPFATIVRFVVDNGPGGEPPKKGEVLVVTQIKPKATCHIAYIDALNNPDPNALARKAADEKAGSFDCDKEPEIIGKFDAWVK